MTPQPAEWPRAGQDTDVDRALTALYRQHYRALVRLVALLVRDVATAEKVVQDCFVAMHGRWRQFGDSDAALSYLRESVVNRSRLAPRPWAADGRRALRSAPGQPGPEHGGIALVEQAAIVAALHELPRRQREALVLRYYGNLSQVQVAAAMGVGAGAVQVHLTRAMNALQGVLQD
jgi:RNA polymerase sigma factor (sigma-70 family)